MAMVVLWFFFVCSFLEVTEKLYHFAHSNKECRCLDTTFEIFMLVALLPRQCSTNTHYP